MKTAILYRSFWGTTKQYAEWLHEEIESDIFKHNKVKKLIMRRQQANTVIE